MTLLLDYDLSDKWALYIPPKVVDKETDDMRECWHIDPQLLQSVVSKTLEIFNYLARDNQQPSQGSGRKSETIDYFIIRIAPHCN